MSVLLAVLERAASQTGPAPHPADPGPGPGAGAGFGFGGSLVCRYSVAGTGASVTVSCPSVEVLRRCDRAAGHAYVSTGPLPGTATGWRVELAVIDPAALQTAPEVFAGAPLIDPGAARPIRCLVGPGWRAFVADDGATVVHVDLGRGRIRVYTARASAGAAWVPQLVRQAMTHQLRVSGGAAFASCAAVIVRDTGILLAGPPGAGKTTALLAALRLAGADLVGDAPLLLDPSDGLLALAWPAPLSLRWGTLAPYPELRDRLGIPDPRPGHEDTAFTLDPGQSDLLLAGGACRDRVRPRLLLLCGLDLDDLDERDGRRPGPGSVLAPEHVRNLALASALFLDERDGPDEPISAPVPATARTDWLTSPAPEAPAPARPGARPSTDTARIASALAALPCHPLTVTADPTDITDQISALLPAPGTLR